MPLPVSSPQWGAEGVVQGRQDVREDAMVRLMNQGKSIENQKQAIALAQQRQLIQLMQQKHQEMEEMGDTADQLDMLGKMSLDAGLFEPAEKAFQASSQIRLRNSTREKNIGTITKDMSTVRLQEERASSEANRRAELSARARLEDARAESLRKGGLNKISPADLKSATDLMDRDYNIPPEDSRIFGRQIVERANELMHSNPALRKTEAMARAYHEKRASGYFTRYMGRSAKPGKQYKMPDGTPLKPGMVVGGYSYTGGDPMKSSSWELAGGEEGVDEEERRALGEDDESGEER